MYENGLPVTGVGLTVGSHYVSLSTIMAIAVALVLLGVVLIRIAGRGKRAALKSGRR